MPSSTNYHFSGFHLDVAQRKLTDESGEVVPLSTRAFDTLHLLITHHGEPVSKSEIMKHVWAGVQVEENNLSQAIFSLRKALRDSSEDSRLILTVPSRGYSFIGQFREENTVSSPETVIEKEQGSISTFFSWFQRPLFPALAVLTLLIISGLAFRMAEKAGSIDVSATTLADSASEGQVVLSAQRSAGALAVLPFSTLSRDETDGFFANGLHDVLTSHLVRIDSLNVVSAQRVSELTSGGDHTLQEVYALLGADSVLTGNVTHAGENIRISVILEDAQTGLSLWASSYDIDGYGETDLMTLQNEIALNVAATLEAEISLSLQENLRAVPSVSDEVYRLTLGATQAFENFDLSRARKLSARALSLDPDYPDALYAHARANSLLSLSPEAGMTYEEHRKEQWQSTQQLYDLEPDAVRSIRMRILALMGRREWTAVPPLYEVFSYVREGDVSPDANIGMFFLVTGDFDKALQIYESRLEYDPMSFYAMALQAVTFELLGLSDLASKNIALGDELSSNWFGENVRVMIQLSRGETPTGVDNLQVPDEIKTMLSRTEDVGMLKELLAARKASGQDNTAFEAMFLSALGAYAGENELAVEFLEEGAIQVSSILYWSWLPIYDEARKTPEFTRLLENMGLVAYWDEAGYPPMCVYSEALLLCDPGANWN